MTFAIFDNVRFKPGSGGSVPEGHFGIDHFWRCIPCSEEVGDLAPGQGSKFLVEVAHPRPIQGGGDDDLHRGHPGLGPNPTVP